MTVPRVLIIDDSEIVRDMLRDTLESAAFAPEVVEAADGGEALRALQEGQFDCVICDLEMPNIDGIEFLRALRAARSRTELPVLLVTGHEEIERKLLGFEAGASDFLSKPWNGAELVARVQTHIELANMHRDLVRDLEARTRMEAAIAESLREKETLLKEVHHRVKNNLQIISSLIGMQVEQMPTEETRQLLEQSARRVRSMALIHQQIYADDSLARIDLRIYAEQLGESIRSALAPHATLRVVADSVEVTVESAVPLGLILNELITNALKYGFPHPRAEGEVRVEITQSPEGLRVVVSDPGPGVPADFDVGQSRSLGLHLVHSLARQLRGKLRWQSEGGARFTFDCPLG
ncbi:MAG: sensor histidine kinase [Myxococcota bacterium]